MYRGLVGAGHYYRIEANDRFTEIQMIGSRRIVHLVNATLYPEKVRIQDMIAGGEGRYRPMDRSEGEAIFAGI